MFAGCSSGEAPSTEAPPAETNGGAELYELYCAECHGSDLRGTDTGPSHLSIIYEPGHHSDESFRSAILNGARQHHFQFGDMPAVENITAQEVELVIEFVRNEQVRLGFEE